MSALAWILTVLIIVAVLLLIAWVIYSRRYQKASQETAFVRTGFGGQKVVMTGGALVFPMLHEVIQVNMNTMRLEIIRENNHALITQDRLRADVHAEFYIRVKPTLDDIATAAQSLGRRTTNPDALKELVEGKFVNGLRVVAAEMSMDELHQNRGEFVRRVQDEVGDGLSKNGLELESVSISELDQTDKKYFNAQNAFDAQGLTLLTEMIQNRAKQRNAIERDTEVAIKKKDLEAERQKLDLSRDEEFARLEQQREIAVHRASQQTDIIKEQTAQEQLAREAELGAKQQIEMTQLQTERTLEEARINKELLLKEKNIASQRALELATIEKTQQTQAASIAAEKAVDEARILTEKLLGEQRMIKDQALEQNQIAKAQAIEKAEIEKSFTLSEVQLTTEQQLNQVRIATEKAVEDARIAKDLHLNQQKIARTRMIEQAEIERRLSTESAELDSAIAIADKNCAHTLALAEVDRARTAAVKAEEQVVTTRQIEIAEREKALTILDSYQKAERDAIAVIELAAAKAKAAVSQAETAGIIASGEANRILKIAEAESQAQLVKSSAAERHYQVEAEGMQRLHEAENVLDPQKSAARIKMAVIDHMAEIIQASVKPIESIDGIKIIQVDGLHPHGTGCTDGAEPPVSGNLSDQLINSALRYRGQAPLVDAVLKEIGIDGGDMGGFRKTIKTQLDEPEDPEK